MRMYNNYQNSMDKYCIKILWLIENYEVINNSGIEMSVLDRKFYEKFDYSKVNLTKQIGFLKEKKLAKKKKPYSLTNKGRQLLLEHN